jgi:hypothetical protein
MRLIQVIAGPVPSIPAVFNPHAMMEHQIKVSSNHVRAFFDEIDSALDKGESVKNAIRSPKGGLQDDRFDGIFSRLISQARLAGFGHGASVSKKSMPAMYGRDVSDRANVRASKVNDWMKRSTRKWLTAVPESDYVLGKERAMRAAQYEASRAYFQGLKDAVGGANFEKAWLTSAGESCEDCQANEDEGGIPVADSFSSGHGYPPAHLSCACFVTMSKGA